MTESGWERSREIRGKRVRIICFTGIPAAVLVTILYFNNQDFIRPLPAENRESGKQVLLQTESAANSPAAPVFNKEDVSLSPAEKNKPAIQVVDSQLKVSSPDLTASRKKDSGKDTDAVQSPENVPIKNFVPETAAVPEAPDPVLISGISCGISDRDDLLVKVSLNIGFSEESNRSEILLRRNEIKVLTKKAVSIKELSVIKKEILEPELKIAINGLFGRELINKVTLSDLQIEKVD